MKTCFQAIVLVLLGCGGGGNCPIGSEGCSCTSGGACDGDLNCLAGVCIAGGVDTHADTITDTATDIGPSDMPDEPMDCTTDADCDDSDPCTTDTCNDMMLCTNQPLDEDGDGFVSAECGGDDCDDSSAVIYPGAVEDSCDDGIDQDCLGLTSTVRSHVEVGFETPWLSDSGEGFAVFMESHHLTRVSLDGAILGQSSWATADLPGSAAAAWSGSSFGVAWKHGADSQTFAALDPAGSPLSSSYDLGANPDVGSEVITKVVWTGSVFSVVWNGGSGLMMGTFDGAGLVETEPTEISGTLRYSNMIGLAWTGSELVVSSVNANYSGNADLHLLRASLDGATVDSSVLVANVIGESSGVEPIAWTGSAIGAVWRSNEDLRDYFGTFDAVGAPITEPVLLPGATTECAVIAPSIEWTGSEFGVLYHKNSPPDLWFARLAPDGSMVDQLDVTDSDAPHTGYKPSLAWSGSVFGAAYVYIGPGSSPVMLDIIGWCN